MYLQCKYIKEWVRFYFFFFGWVWVFWKNQDVGTLNSITWDPVLMREWCIILQHDSMWLRNRTYYASYFIFLFFCSTFSSKLLLLFSIKLLGWVVYKVKRRTEMRKDVLFLVLILGFIVKHLPLSSALQPEPMYRVPYNFGQLHLFHVLRDLFFYMILELHSVVFPQKNNSSQLYVMVFLLHVFYCGFSLPLKFLRLSVSFLKL